MLPFKGVLGAVRFPEMDHKTKEYWSKSSKSEQCHFSNSSVPVVIENLWFMDHVSHVLYVNIKGIWAKGTWEYSSLCLQLFRKPKTIWSLKVIKKWQRAVSLHLCTQDQKIEQYRCSDKSNNKEHTSALSEQPLETGGSSNWAKAQGASVYLAMLHFLTWSDGWLYVFILQHCIELYFMLHDPSRNKKFKNTFVLFSVADEGSGWKMMWK